MGYCSAPLVMPGISGTRKKNPNQAHKASPWVHPCFFPATRAKTWECHERVSKGKIKSQGILTPSCFRAKWFAGRTSPRIAPVLFAGRQNRCLLNSSEGFFFISWKKSLKIPRVSTEFQPRVLPEAFPMVQRSSLPKKPIRISGLHKTCGNTHQSGTDTGNTTGQPAQEGIKTLGSNWAQQD